MEATKQKEDITNREGYGFWSHQTCFSCGYDLEYNYPDDWQKKTGCPVCNKSFVS